MTQGAAAQMASLLLADSRLPVGGYTVSGGLEPALLGGLTVSDVPAYIAMRLATVARVEAGAAVVAATAVRALRSQAPAGICTPDDVAWAWAARTPVPAVRESSIAQGRAMLRLVRRLRPHGAAAQWLSPLPRTLMARSVVLGAFAGELGLDGAGVARVVGYDDVQAVTAAALKLLPLDPLDVAAWSLEAAEPLEALVASCSSCAAPQDIPAHSTPQLDAWHHTHAVTDRRLFRV